MLIKSVDTKKLENSSNSREDWNIRPTEMAKLKTVTTETELNFNCKM